MPQLAKTLIVILIAILLTAGAYAIWTTIRPESSGNPVDYQLRAAPYYGVYNSLISGQRLLRVAVPAMMFGYWGDERFPLETLVQAIDTDQSVFNALPTFLESNGYEVESKVFMDSEGDASQALSFIRRHVNPEKQTPVIVLQRASSDPAFISSGMVLVMGISDSDQTVTLYDTVYGFDYVISYDEFSRRFASYAAAAIAAWPRGEILSTLRPVPATNIGDPTEMRRLGTLIMHAFDASSYYAGREFKLAADKMREMVSDARFSELPRAVQVYYLSSYAEGLFQAGDLEEAKRVLTEQALALNENLNEPDELWTTHTKYFATRDGELKEQKLIRPYLILARIALKQGDSEKAKEYIDDAEAIFPESEAVSLVRSQIR